MSELVELFGVIAPTLTSAIKAISRNEVLNSITTQQYDLAMPQSWATFYTLEVVIALAFQLNTYEASRIREKVLKGLHRRKENGLYLLLKLDNTKVKMGY